MANKRLHESTLSEEDFKIIAPVSKEQFNELARFCNPVQVNPNMRRYISRQDLLTFLCKMRQGLSDELLKIMFGYKTRQRTSLAVAKVRETLMQHFVPHNLGLSISREDFIQRHVTEFANELYNPEPERPCVIVFVDATYVYIPKSSNYKVLRPSFNVFKGRHLLKPVLMVGSDGYILDVYGPYFSNARNNDASILMNEFNRDRELMESWFQAGDVFVVDRGYRDSIPLLNRLGIIHKMPHLLKQEQKQFTIEEANESRLITKMRWVIEGMGT